VYDEKLQYCIAGTARLTTVALFGGRSGLRSARVANQSSERPPLSAREACCRSNLMGSI